MAPRGPVVLLAGVQGLRGRAHAPLRTQAQVHAVHVALVGQVGEGRGEAQGQHLVELGPAGGGGGFGHSPLVGFVHVDEVDIGAEVELAASELAQAQHGEARRLAPLRAGLGQGGEAALVPERALGRLVGFLDERFRQARQRPHGLGHAGEPQEIADADVQDLAPPRDPQQVEPPRLRLQGKERAVEISLDVAAGPGPIEHVRLRQPVEPGGVADEDLGHEAAGSEHPGHDLHGPRLGLEMGEEGERAAAHGHEPLEMVQGPVRIGRVGEAAEELGKKPGQEDASRGVGRDRLQVAVGRAGVAEAVGLEQRLCPTRRKVGGQQQVADVDGHGWTGL